MATAQYIVLGPDDDIVFGDAGFDMALQDDKPSDDTVALDDAGMQLTHIASGVAD